MFNSLKITLTVVKDIFIVFNHVLKWGNVFVFIEDVLLCKDLY